MLTAAIPADRFRVLNFSNILSLGNPWEKEYFIEEWAQGLHL